MGSPFAEPESFSLFSTIKFVDELEKTFNDLSLRTRRPDIYPFDIVAGEMLSKAFALSRSAVILIQNGFPDEGFGLCRSLYECSMYLRFITQSKEQINERANKFLHFGLTSKAFWFDLLHKSSILTQTEREDLWRYRQRI